MVSTINDNELDLSITECAVTLIETEFPLLEGIDHLAKKIGVSKCHLIRCFTTDIGVSPGKYLTNVRISAAKTYLEQEDYSVEMIAGLVGYACGNYFAKVFRKVTGFSPTSYKQDHPAIDDTQTKYHRVSDDISFI